MNSVIGRQVEVMRIVDEDRVASEGRDISFLLLLIEGNGDLVPKVLGKLSLVNGDR